MRQRKKMTAADWKRAKRDFPLAAMHDKMMEMFTKVKATTPRKMVEFLELRNPDRIKDFIGVAAEALMEQLEEDNLINLSMIKPRLRKQYVEMMYERLMFILFLTFLDGIQAKRANLV